MLDISKGLSILPNNHKSSCDNRTLFAGASRQADMFLFTPQPNSVRWRDGMTSYDQCVIAPPGRFDGIERPYSPEDVIRLRGSVPIEHSLARRGALKLWELLKRDEPVRALGAVTGISAILYPLSSILTIARPGRW